MKFPANHTVGWHKAGTGSVDARGNPTHNHTPLLADPGTSVPVISWGPTQTAETDEVRVEVELDLFMNLQDLPNGAGPRDVVDLPLDKSLGQFEVVGFPKDFTKGLVTGFGGIVVQLKRIQS